MGTTKPLFRELNADDPDPEATVIDSLCMNCQEQVFSPNIYLGKVSKLSDIFQGVTRLLLTKIPFYKEVVLMSFSCDHCGYQNNEIQSGAPVSEKGLKITLNVKSERDLNRQVVKSDYTSIKIVDIDFEIPAKSQKGGKRYE